MDASDNEVVKLKKAEQKSVLAGETPFISFDVDGQNVGNLWCKGGVFSFDGSVDLSGKAFFSEITQHLTDQLQEELKGGLNSVLGIGD